MNHYLRTLAIVGTLFFASQCRSSEPQPARLLVIRGVVWDSALSTPVEAYVSLTNSREGVFASKTGEFELRVHRPVTASPILFVRRIGYEPKRIPLSLGVDTVVNVGHLQLRQAPLQLDDLIVDSPRAPSRN